MESIIGFILRGVAYLVVDGLLYLTAKAVVPLCTFGRLPVKPLCDRKSTRAGHRFFRRQPDGTILVSDDLAILLGLLIWLIIGVILYAALR